jgi:hypothetical protein
MLKYDLEYICCRMHNMAMKWKVVFHEEFDKEFNAFDGPSCLSVATRLGSIRNGATGGSSPLPMSVLTGTWHL